MIDAHSHLGDILEPHGADLIWKKNIVKKRTFDLQVLSEMFLNRTFFYGKIIYMAMGRAFVWSERARNAVATLENMSASLDGSCIDYTVCLPLAPYVTFEDLKKAAAADPRIIPFASPDFSSGGNGLDGVVRDMKNGARGMKLHPIIQSVSPTDRRIMELLQGYERFKKPVAVHAGYSSYYLGKDAARERPRFGAIAPIAEMVSSFPGINFIIGHAGLFQANSVIKLISRMKNAFVDTSFQSPHMIRKLVRSFGAERVLFASDWPFGMRMPAVRAVEAAFRKDDVLKRMIFHDNAARLLSVVD